MAKRRPRPKRRANKSNVSQSREDDQGRSPTSHSSSHTLQRSHRRCLLRRPANTMAAVVHVQSGSRIYYKPPPITERRLGFQKEAYIKSIGHKAKLRARPKQSVWDDEIQLNWTSQHKAEPTEDSQEIDHRSWARPLYPLSVKSPGVPSSERPFQKSLDQSALPLMKMLGIPDLSFMLLKELRFHQHLQGLAATCTTVFEALYATMTHWDHRSAEYPMDTDDYSETGLRTAPFVMVGHWRDELSRVSGKRHEPSYDFVLNSTHMLSNALADAGGSVKILQLHGIPFFDTRVLADVVPVLRSLRFLGIYACPLVNFCTMNDIADVLVKRKDEFPAFPVVELDIYPYYFAGPRGGKGIEYGIAFSDFGLSTLAVVASTLCYHVLPKLDKLGCNFYDADSALRRFLERAPLPPMFVVRLLQAYSTMARSLAKNNDELPEADRRVFEQELALLCHPPTTLSNVLTNEQFTHLCTQRRCAKCGSMQPVTTHRNYQSAYCGFCGLRLALELDQPFFTFDKRLIMATWKYHGRFDIAMDRARQLEIIRQHLKNHVKHPKRTWYFPDNASAYVPCPEVGDDERPQVQPRHPWAKGITTEGHWTVQLDSKYYVPSLSEADMAKVYEDFLGSADLANLKPDGTLHQPDKPALKEEEPEVKEFW